ncbi:MAG: nuclear transport factor 2 family protein [Desulfatitalea sp.]|nr:nuclear transport factor 2 family protein [Desulfatitalea sp.]NNK02638.1 nuclear transport factor 2 family protein [Desulfatitalea sp.]
MKLEKEDDSFVEKVQWLVDRALISELLFSFARALDTKDVVGYIDNYTQDAILELPDPASKSGAAITIHRNEMEDFLRKGLITGYTATHHISTNHQIVITDDTASSRAYLQAVHVKTNPLDHWDAGGWYDCKHIRTPEGWKFTHVKLTAVWITGEPGSIKPA